MTALAGGLPGARLYWFSSDVDRGRVGALIVDAARAITRDDQQSRDSFRLFRSSWGDIQKHKDGLTLDTQGLSALTTAVAKLLPPSDRRGGDKFWVDQTRKTHTKTAAAYGIVAVPNSDDNAHRLMGGRLLERVHLWTALNGIALHHMNQMTERADRERQLRLLPRFGPELQGLIPDGGWQPLVAFRGRAGHGRLNQWVLDAEQLGKRRPGGHGRASLAAAKPARGYREARAPAADHAVKRERPRSSSRPTAAALSITALRRLTRKASPRLRRREVFRGKSVLQLWNGFPPGGRP
jgi:hypothetical protein